MPQMFTVYCPGAQKGHTVSRITTDERVQSDSVESVPIDLSVNQHDTPMSPEETTWEFHEFANIYPLMKGDCFRNFIDDMRKNGPRERIVIYKGKILDGRNRYRAMKDLGRVNELKTEEFTGNDEKALNFVRSKNLHRRHLTPSQSAAIAIKNEDLFAKFREEAKARQCANAPKKGQQKFQKKTVSQDSGPPSNSKDRKTDNILAKEFNTNPEYLRQARKIDSEDPNLLNDVIEGKKNIHKATK